MTWHAQMVCRMQRFDVLQASWFNLVIHPLPPQSIWVLKLMYKAVLEVEPVGVVGVVGLSGHCDDGDELQFNTS